MGGLGTTGILAESLYLCHVATGASHMGVCNRERRPPNTVRLGWVTWRLLARHSRPMAVMFGQGMAYSFGNGWPSDCPYAGPMRAMLDEADGSVVGS